ncbi:MAG: bifunctional 3-(3-hydroxy-phenyl)propionate/3-hydroxycinnamic acid hydroxylase [Alphaproteobacteria bacterium]|nr:MAG: bifunctional 3-(3-hydroxy-phenyl)propionate/3-hydroxycinnamic acid hydroxylase [Alphaproteobacteria bacterium]
MACTATPAANACRAPAARSSEPMAVRWDVAVIGCGPVGALLANLLGRRGHSVIVLEKRPAPYPLPRAIHFDGEAMRGFQAAGLAEAVLSATVVGKGMRFLDGAGEVLLDWPRAQEPGPLGWHESYRFHQPSLEAALRRGLERFAAVELVEGREVVGVAEGADAVVLRLAGGGEVRARFAVACDGASSRLAARIAGGFEDLGFDERWIVADVRVTAPRGDLGDLSLQFCDSRAPATYVRGIRDWRRWEARLMPGDPEDMEPRAAWERLVAARGIGGVTLERAAIYRFRSRVARRWRQGRLFIAGDAAHQMPPFMGQGLCAGVRDAVNLAWKLSARLAGRGDEALLDSYGSERRANVLEFIRRSVALGRLINRSAGGAPPARRMTSIWPPLGPGLGPRDGIGGTLCPQPRLAGGRLGDDVAGHGFHVLAQGAARSLLPVLPAPAELRLPATLQGVVVRPDGYALGGFADAASLGALEQSAAAHAPAPVVAA